MEVQDKENDVKKSKVYQFKQYSAGKLPLGNKQGGQKFSLRNNAFKPLKRAESSTQDNFFHLKSAMGQRNSFNDKKFTKGDGFEMLARGTDSFKKFEPIGRTLQTFQMNKRSNNNNNNSNNSNVKRGSAIYHDSSKQPIWYNNFGMATGGGFQSKMQRANSSTHGFKSNNFMKTSEGFNTSSKRALTYVNPHYSSSNNNNSKQTALENHKNNNNANENSRNSQNTNIPTSTASNSTNNFNFKKQTDTESSNNNTGNNNNKKFRNSKSNNNTITKKKINDAMQKASLYTDDVIRRQYVFEQQEREEEEQFIELCGMLNSIQLN